MRQAEKVSPASTNRDLAALRYMLNFAYRQGDMARNPVRGVGFLDEGPGFMRVVSHEEEERYLVRPFLAGLMLLAGLILLAACANLGSLFAAREAERSREIALRLALGAGRLRILRQFFTEAIVISLMGGAVGLWASVMLLGGMSKWQPFPEFPINVPVSPDASVYGAALLLALASGFLFGAVPMKQVLETDPYGVIKSGSAGSLGGSRRRRITARDLLLAAQIAICAVLVTSSLVAARGLARSLDSKLGVQPQNAILVDTDVTRAGYTGDRTPDIQRRMIDAMKAIPGVNAVGLVGQYPPLHMGWNSTNVFIDQTTDLRPSSAARETILYSVSPEYFQAAGTALLSGRAFTWHDDKNSTRVAVVNQEFARRIFGCYPMPWADTSRGRMERAFKWWRWSKTENTR